MTTNYSQPGSPEVGKPAAGIPRAPAPGVNLPTSIAKERLEALRSELDADRNHWPEHMAATLDEDCRQLMKDFGFQ